MKIPELTAPAPISAENELDSFQSGEASLDKRLKERALKNQASGASRCFVICDKKIIVGYYYLSAGAIARESALKTMQRNVPDSMPVLLLGRLAIDKKYHNKGLGSALLRDALLRALALSEAVGIVAVLVHALSEQAKRFYLSRGFVQSPLQEMTLMMTLKTIRAVLSELAQL